MTVSYQYDVACSTSGGFTRLLFKWKGSVYKLVYRELIWFCIAYATVSIVYRSVLSDPQKRFFENLVSYCELFTSTIPLPFVLGFYVTFVASRWWSQFEAIPWPDKDFEVVVDYCNTFINHIPLTFVLGFYVTFVAQRWWQQYIAIPWPDKILHCISLYMSGTDENSRIIRRTLMRYLNLSLILVLRSISMAVKKRFPTLQHVVEAGFMTKIELDLYQQVPSVEFNTYWIPCTWFINLLKDCRQNNLINDNQGLKLIMEEFNEYRSRCGLLWSYDWVSIPLVYTQVVTLATYSFFIACIVGRQYVEGGIDGLAKNKVDLYVPIFTLLQFFFYMGLLKVAEALINPFGDDDEDFELNWIIDRHTKVSYLVVDSLFSKNPPIVKDAHFDEATPVLAYTRAAMAYKKKTYRGSVARVNVPEDQQTLVLPDIPEEADDDSQHSELTESGKRSASSFLNLLNPDKSWTTTQSGKHRHHGRHPGNAVHTQGRLSTSSLPEDALPGPKGLPKMPLGPEPQSAPGTLARHPRRPYHVIHRDMAPAPSSESLAPSEISEVGSAGGGDASPDLTSSRRRASHPGICRTLSNASTEAGDVGSSSNFVRSKWRMVRKRFMRNKSHSIAVESPAELMSAGALPENKSMSSPDVQVDIEGPTTDDPGGGSESDSAGTNNKASPKQRARRKRSGKFRSKVPPPPSLSPSSRESMLSATGTTSCESMEHAPDSGIPSVGTSTGELNHDYAHPYYIARSTQSVVKKSPPARQRTSSLATDRSSPTLDLSTKKDGDDVIGTAKPGTARSMPNLRSGNSPKVQSSGSLPSSHSTILSESAESKESTSAHLSSLDKGSRGSIHV